MYAWFIMNMCHINNYTENKVIERRRRGGLPRTKASIQQNMLHSIYAPPHATTPTPSRGARRPLGYSQCTCRSSTVVSHYTCRRHQAKENSGIPVRITANNIAAAARQRSAFAGERSEATSPGHWFITIRRRCAPPPSLADAVKREPAVRSSWTRMYLYRRRMTHRNFLPAL